VYLWAHAKSNQNQTKRDLFTSHRINAPISLLPTNSPQRKRKKKYNKPVQFPSLLREANITDRAPVGT